MPKDLATDTELLCPSCSKFGCKCSTPRCSFPTEKDVCRACRRALALCICVSHVGLNEQVAEAEGDPLPITGKMGPQQIEGKVNEAMHIYYNRDAAGLARWIRQNLR